MKTKLALLVVLFVVAMVSYVEAAPPASSTELSITSAPDMVNLNCGKDACSKKATCDKSKEACPKKTEGSETKKSCPKKAAKAKGGCNKSKGGCNKTK